MHFKDRGLPLRLLSGVTFAVAVGIVVLAACAPSARSVAMPAAVAPTAPGIAPELPPPTATLRDATSATNRRAILISFDAINEGRALETIPAAAIPTFRAMFANAACAASARPAFPSVTAPGHAALWTGAYGNVNGISANAQPQLPRSEHSLMSRVSGYFVDALRAEPIWITAARDGRRVAGHHVTQAPDAPGYPYTGDETDAERASLDSARTEARRVLQMNELFVMNGYNVSVAPSWLLTERDVTPRAGGAWRGVASLNSGVQPLEISWLAGADSLFALLYGARVYDRVVLAGTRDVAAGVVVREAPVDTSAPLVNRELARHFPNAVLVETAQGPVPLTGRLFAVADDASTFELLIPELRVVEGSNRDQARAYQAAIGGWYGNGALSVYRSGRFGPTIMSGGKGSAELRYLESLEHVTRQDMRGSEWMWRTQRAELMLDYFPLIDEVDHEWYGYVDATTALYDASVGTRLQVYRARAWSLADRRLSALHALVAQDSAAALIVSGDHGMRTFWRGFRPNVALREAGLLALNSDGRVDLSRTKAYSPNGYYVMINRVAWKDGIVPPSEEKAVLDAAERAVLAARSPEGSPVVVHTWRADAPGADTLGLGGPAGGDLYYDVARGYTWNAGVADPVSSELSRPGSTHGFPSTSPEMQTVLCLWSRGVSPNRIGAARSSDAALITSDWLGIPRPANAQGVSPYRRLIKP